MEILVLGVERVVVVKLDSTGPFLAAKYRVLELPSDAGSEVEALSGALLELAGKAIALAQPQTAPELTRMLAGSEDPLRLAYLLASVFSLDVATRTETARSGDAGGCASANSLLPGARTAGARTAAEDRLDRTRRNEQGAA